MTKPETIKHIHLIKGDITTYQGTSIVNAANKYLEAGGGVCGAIFDAAGYRKLQDACDELSPIGVGEAVLTPGFNLAAKYVIHAVGPRYMIDNPSEELLANAYRSIFRVCKENDIEDVAIPSISTGIYGYPLYEAVDIALREIMDALTKEEIKDVYVYAYDERTYMAYKAGIERI